MTIAAPIAAVTAGYWTAMSPYSQLLGPFPFRGDPSTDRPAKTVCLTFDDGPNEPFTSQIAAFLGDRDIKATFFQVGRCVERHPQTSRRLLESGHVVGNHSYGHQFRRCWTERDIADELAKSQDVFRENIGTEPAMYRPPWLARTPATFRLLADRGLQAVSGEFCHALEPLQPSSLRIVRRTLAKVRPGSIIIFHDGFDARGGNRTNTVEAVKLVVDNLLQAGYEFATADKLLGIRPYVDGS